MIDCEECIYRNECGKSVHECRDRGGGRIDAAEQAYRDGYAAGLKAGKPKWIPVKDKMPPKDKYVPEQTEDVLVLLGDGSVDIAYYSEYTDMWHGNFDSYGHVIEWMPLESIKRDNQI